VRSGRKRKPTPGTTRASQRLIRGSVASRTPPPLTLTEVTAATKSGCYMKIKLFAGHHEAAQALVLSIAGVTAIMLIANLILMAEVDQRITTANKKATNHLAAEVVQLRPRDVPEGTHPNSSSKAGR
jgi:hypothetical protein